MLFTAVFSICGLLHIGILMVVYFLKEKIKSLENKIFSILIVGNFIGLILDIGCFILGYNYHISGILNNIFFRGLLVYYISWLSVFSLYVYLVANISEKKYSRYKKITIFFMVITILLSLVLPLEFAMKDKMVEYTTGPAVYTVFAYSGVVILTWIIFLIKNRKETNKKKAIPIAAFFVLGIVVMLIQLINPSLILLTALEEFVVFLMYSTIENPDMKLINELNIARDQAEKANNAKTDFLSNMSHEIRTPLNAIVGFSQTLSEEDIPEQAKEEVNDIVVASQNLLEIVNGILDISKIEADKLEIINTEYSFKTLFNELISLTKARLGDKPLELRFVYDESIPPVLFGDKSRIKQIAINLLTNAVKYTKEGWVEFKIGSIKKEGVCRIILSVEDSGIGIKPEKINRLFTKFDRLEVERNDTIEGTGLGLAITKKLVNLMGGQIVVQSVFGSGSKFTVAIDQVISDKKFTDTGKFDAINDEKQIIIPNLKVLVVDDNKINLKVARRFLEKYQCQIEEVDNGQSCLDRIISGEKFDLILLDDMMPRMSGVETLKKLKEIPEFKIPTVALTANAISGMREKYMADGFDEYLPKPLDKKELDKIIRRFLINE